ncbi:MAG: hypothetical protein LBQ27_00895 [Clostridiales bacterium]|jgi:hypothetical protein|nr:hypothetical protein [Clostridiales bacterium]
MSKEKYYHIKSNDNLHEIAELEYNHYLALVIDAEESGDYDLAEVYRNTADKLAYLQTRMFLPGLTWEEMSFLKEVSFARAVRGDEIYYCSDRYLEDGYEASYVDESID